jgi:hypothetical protein
MAEGWIERAGRISLHRGQGHHPGAGYWEQTSQCQEHTSLAGCLMNKVTFLSGSRPDPKNKFTE